MLEGAKPEDIQSLEDAVEELAGAATGHRPVFAIPWTDIVNADPIADIMAMKKKIEEM